MIRRRHALVWVLIVAMVASVGTWWITRLAAENSTTDLLSHSPPSVPVAAKIEKGPLVSYRTVPGILHRGNQTGVKIRWSGDSEPVVTRIATAPGEKLASGDCPLEIAGNPIMALSIPFGLYRPLEPGSAGPDVSAIVQALKAARIVADSEPEKITPELLAKLSARCGGTGFTSSIPMWSIARIPGPIVEVGSIGVQVGDQIVESTDAMVVWTGGPACDGDKRRSGGSRSVGAQFDLRRRSAER